MIQAMIKSMNYTDGDNYENKMIRKKERKKEQQEKRRKDDRGKERVMELQRMLGFE